MLIDYKYIYLVSTSLTLIPWFLLYFTRRDQRRELIIMSIFGAFVGFFTEYFFWTVDWWQPYTITGTGVGFEDILLGFTNFGIGGVVYEYLFRRANYKRLDRFRKISPKVLVLLVGVVFLVMFYGFNITSFYSYVIACLIWLLGVFFIRKDLFNNSIITGFIMLIACYPLFSFIQFGSPGWIEEVWKFEHISGYLFLGVPVEDYIFFFFTGVCLGPFYELIHGEAYRKVRRGSK